ncbi:ABC transporter permease [Neorhizobium alkalisoli]|uniref:Putative spermidine/putrescine transport system permease protein n=1 Tax=Neorhizobium alkalisoli TaxID=528178 RepID=A0A561Q7S1_9HYPH|nr:ABC transporter permease [Neorhizobium alkalisoli]TWF46434.1 putative spermidine/putrescine transport system permease protein [Neorhizobium alkalisoli]
MTTIVTTPQVIERRQKGPGWGQVLLAAYVLLFFAFLLLPIAIVVLVSFSSSSFIVFPMPGFSTQWYYRIVEYRPFMQSLLVSVEIALLSALAGTVLGVPAAIWAVRANTNAAQVFTNVMLAPISVPAILLGFSLLYMLSALTLGVSFLSLLITHTVVAIPYISRTVLAVYRGIPADYEEAAAVLGASRAQIFFQITMPLIKPGIFAGALFSVLISLDNLPLSFFFGGASSSSLPVVMLSYMQNQFDPSIAAIATVQMLIAIVALGIVNAIYGVDKLTAA